ncbi:MAG TPA: glycosyltransferase [Actinomycetota bacterium]|nr:glycosyltransferase [Actinomycetota bacterium]
MNEIVCLLPVRNGAQDLTGYLAAAPAWCDAIVALDDGSTDETRDLLEASPLVRIVLTNPRRETHAGWHDGANRNRLIEAVAGLDPDWIVSVDVDERIPNDDAEAMRAFLATDALPGLAYGLQHLRMWDADRFDPDVRWVYRLFAFRPGLSFPDERLHFNPVPTEIARTAWVRTTVRLQHFAASSEDRIETRLTKYREADPEGVYPVGFGGLHAPPHQVEEWEPRPSGLPVLPGPDEQLGRTAAGALRQDRGGPLLVALVPAKDCEEDLPGYFESVSRVADAVVALDDGSTDGTREVLRAQPLVRVLLGRPRRPDYRGWDDAANRAMLLEAAARLQPTWILSLDSDERIDPDDARALRTFLEEEADPAFAYSFRVHRMIGDLEHFDRADLWATRLFAFEPGQGFSGERLHFVPVPDSIPPDRYVPTTVRIQHLASLTEERRRARFEKYRQADPAGAYQDDYGELLAPPGTVRPWERRPLDLPVVLEPRELPPLEDEERSAALELDAPVLSAIVIARDDEDRIERTVRSVVEQRTPEPFEVIVVTSGNDRTAEIVRERFPDVTLVELDRPALPGEARNAGLSVARGDYVSFPGSHVLLPGGSLAARIRAHQLGHPMVTGTTLNLTDTPAGWASYFLDHSTVLPGRPSGELGVPPAHCSYDREFLLRIGGFPEDLRAGEDTVANVRLSRLGYRAYRAADVVLYHDSPCRDALRLVRHHFSRGRGLGRILLESAPVGGRLLNRGMVRFRLFGYLPTRLSQTAQNVARWGDDELRRRYRSVRHLVTLGASAAFAGTWFEIVRPAPGKMRTLFGKPALHVVFAGLDRRGVFRVGRTDVLLVARIEPLSGRARILSLPRDLLVDIAGTGPGRLNEAYFDGADGVPEDPKAGMRLLARTLRNTLSVPIHGCVVVDFDGFRRLVDALGGVEIEVPHAIDDEFVGEDGELFSAHFRPGRQLLDGDAALTYARTRRADGDRWRRQRHVDISVALVRAALRVRSPGRALRVVRAAASAITTDLSIPRLALAAQALARAVGRRLTIVSVAPPLVRSVRTEEGRWVHRGDPVEIAGFVRRRWVVGEPEDRPGEPVGRSDQVTSIVFGLE